MPPIQTQYILHLFDGGWATDFGKFVGSPPASGLPNHGTVRIPYFQEADNVFWDLDGSAKKIGGTSKISARLGSGAVIYGVYDYWKVGTSGTHAQRKVCHVSTLIMEDQGNGTWQNLFTGLEAAKHPNYSTFNDLLIIASTSNTDVPKSWDQSTAQNLAGSPPNFAFSCEHHNRHWAAGVVANPSRLYYSAFTDPEDWSGYGSGNIDISPGDGDEITGIASFKDELWVFKGPNKGSIHRITGKVPEDFARIKFIDGLGAVGQSTITQFKDDLIFMTPSGTIRSLKATAAFGDYNEASLTFPINNNWIKPQLNKTKLKQAWMVDDPTTSHVYVAAPTGSSTTNNVILCYDYQFDSVQKPNRWSRLTAWPAQCLAKYTSSQLPLVMAGGADGYVRGLNTSSKSIDGDDSINGNLKSPYLNYGSSIQFKTLTTVGLTLTPSGDDAVTFNWNRDSTNTQSAEITQGSAYDELRDASSPQPGDFHFGTSKLAGDAFVESFYDTEEGGHFRWVKYQFIQNGIDEDLYLHAFSTGLQYGAFGTEPNS